MDREFQPKLVRTILQTFVFVGLKTPGIVRDFLGDQFALIESSADQILTNFILHSCFFFYFLEGKRASHD